uniref:Proteasome activator complex subunit 4 C-terminal domain-containing protein n=1 Tax=Trypanosoma congolense (strain IL3000) TaxID=1068625 RepID=G0UR21_TRYCI|nr:conserved hypothetical protein [Trypanosoma congolense IL3000]
MPDDKESVSSDYHSLDNDDAIFEYQHVLPCSMHVVHPTLKEDVEKKDRATILKASQLLLDFGTPEEVAGKIAKRHKKPEESAGCSEKENGDLLFGVAAGTGTPIPLRPIFDAPLDKYDDVFEADRELRRRCLHLSATLEGEYVFYCLPLDMLRRVGPLLYSWITDLDFLLRSNAAWCSVVDCFCIALRSTGVMRNSRTDFFLPWRPLVRLLFLVLTEDKPGSALLGVARICRDLLPYIQKLCDTASKFFEAEALDDLWSILTPRFGFCVMSASLAMWILYKLMPIRSLYDPHSGVLLPVAGRIVRLLLMEGRYWHPRSVNWLGLSLMFVFKICYAGIGLIDLNSYAEAVFTMVLSFVEFPISDEERCFHRKSNTVPIGADNIISVNCPNVMRLFGYIVNVLPKDTNSPLWNHLRRFVSSTSVFLSPGCRKKWGFGNLTRFYKSLLEAACMRMRRQRWYEQNVSDSPELVAPCYYISEEYLWTEDTVQCLVDIVSPTVLTLLHDANGKVVGVLSALAFLSPKTFLPHIVKSIEKGSQHFQESPDHCAACLELLWNSYLSLLDCRETREDFLALLVQVLRMLPRWINYSHRDVCCYALRLFLAICSVESLRELLGGEDAECEYVADVVSHFFTFCCSNRGEWSHDYLSNFSKALFANVSEEAFTYCMKKIFKNAENWTNESEAFVGCCLLESLARRSPEPVMRWAASFLVPQLLCTVATRDSDDIMRCSTLLSGCVRGAGQSCFPYRRELLQCILAQLTFVTNKNRIKAATEIYTALFSGLKKVSCVEVVDVEASSAVRCGDNNDGSDAEAVDSLLGPREKCLEEKSRFYRLKDVNFKWNEPSVEHVTFLHEIYQSFLLEIITVIQNIENVSPPSSSGTIRGLYAFLPSSINTTVQGSAAFQNQDNDDNNMTVTTEQQHSPTQMPLSTTANTDDEFTPHCVLISVLDWLLNVLKINRDLRPHWKNKNEPGMEAWHEVEPRAMWVLCAPSEEIAEKSKSLTDDIHPLIMEHVLRRVTGGVADEGIVSIALQRSQSFFVQGKSALDATHSTNVDDEGLLLVMSILMERAGFTKAELTDDSFIGKSTRNNYVHRRFLLRMMKRYTGLPKNFWMNESEKTIEDRQLSTFVSISPACFGDIFALTYSMLFSRSRKIKTASINVVLLLLPLIGNSGRERFLLRHLDVMEKISELCADEKFYAISEEEGDVQTTEIEAVEPKSKARPHSKSLPDTANILLVKDDEYVGNSTGTESGICPLRTTGAITADGCDVSGEGGDGVGSETARVEPLKCGEKRNIFSKTRLREEVRFSLCFLRGRYRHFCSLSGGAVIKRATEVYTNLSKVLGITTIDVGIHQSISIEEKTIPKPSIAADYASDVFTHAEKLVHSAPRYTQHLLWHVSVCFNVSPVEIPSPTAVTMLFKLVSGIDAQVSKTAQVLLLAVLKCLKEKQKKKRVLMRRGDVDEEGSVSFFRNRCELLRQRCGTRFRVFQHSGFIFPPKYITIDDSCVLPDVLDDGEPLLVPSNEIVSCRQYLQSETEYSVVGSNPENKQKLEEIRAVVARVSGIVQEDGCRPTDGTEMRKDNLMNLDTDEAETLKKSWIWKMLTVQRENASGTGASSCLIWELLGKVVGVEVSAEVYTKIACLMFREYVEALQDGAAAATVTEQRWLICADLLNAAIIFSKRFPSVRKVVLECALQIVVEACTNIRIPSKECSYLTNRVGGVGIKLNAEEVWMACEKLFATLPRSIVEEGSSQVPACPDKGSFSADDAQGKTSYSGATRGISSILFALSKLVKSPVVCGNVEITSKLCKCITDRKDLFLFSDSINICKASTEVISTVLHSCFCLSDCTPWNSNVLEDVLNFMRHMYETVELQCNVQLTGSCDKSLERTVTTIESEKNSCADATELVASHAVESGVTAAENIPHAEERKLYSALKVLTLIWLRPVPKVFEALWKECLTAIIRLLDIPLVRIDGMDKEIFSVLKSIALTHLPKDVVLLEMKYFCDVLEEKYPFGRTKGAKIAVTRALYHMLVVNVHRIGKYEAIKSVVGAATACIGQEDGDVRERSRSLLAVLSRVASAGQITNIINEFFEELRQLQTSSSESGDVAVMCASSSIPQAATEKCSAERRRRTILLTLCSFLSVHVGPTTPYLKPLMRYLVRFEHDTSNLVRAEVKRAFQMWWGTHRSGWELCYNEDFTPEEVERLMALMKAPTYLF